MPPRPGVKLPNGSQTTVFRSGLDQGRVAMKEISLKRSFELPRGPQFPRRKHGLSTICSHFWSAHRFSCRVIRGLCTPRRLSAFPSFSCSARPTRFTISPGPTPRPDEYTSLCPVALVDVDVRRPPACVRYRLPSSPKRFAGFVRTASGPGLEYQSTQIDAPGQANSRSLPELDRRRRDGDSGLARTS